MNRENEFSTDEESNLSRPLISPLLRQGSLRSLNNSLDQFNDNNSRDFSWWKKRTQYYIPVFGWLPSYQLKNLPYDIRAGITVACLIIPQCISYGSLTLISPQHGLYAALIPSLMYSFFGTSRHLSFGPEALISMLVGSLIKDQQATFFLQHPDATEQDRVLFASMIACMCSIFVGALTLALGIFKMGYLDSLLSVAGLRGFISGAAIVIIFDTSITAVGLEKLASRQLPGTHTTFGTINFFIKNYKNIHPLTCYISAGSLIFLFVVLLIKRAIKNTPKEKVVFAGIIKAKHFSFILQIPEMLVLIITLIILSTHYNWSSKGVAIFGTVNSKLPSFKIPSIPDGTSGKDVLSASLTMLIIGVIESLIISREYANKNHYSVSSNRELVAYGVANIAGGFFSSYPAFGSLSRSKLNDKSHAKTQLSGLFTFLITLTFTAYLLHLLHNLPKAALSAIVIYTAISLLPPLPKNVSFLLKVRSYSDLFLLSVVMVSCLLISIESGVLVAISASVITVIKRTNLPKIKLLGLTHDNSGYLVPVHEEVDDLDVLHIEGVLIISVEEPLYFSNAFQLRARLNRLELFGDMRVHPSEDRILSPTRAIIFELSRMFEIDGSAIMILMGIVEEYKSRNVIICIAGCRNDAINMFNLSGMTELVGRNMFFPTVQSAIEYLQST
ncbi:putative sulfate transporter [Smittium mucronatum]|uniref:Putative sulfate transporter n=1 Tax=Smittium mucronatum TaxID=133383 RepID=A0A1R0GYE5_9FUNG|nr:putative sulfate transporter [Smittium mucronatum]